MTKLWTIKDGEKLIYFDKSNSDLGIRYIGGLMKFWMLEKADKKLPFIQYKGKIYLFIYPTKILAEQTIRHLIPNEKDILIFEKELKLEKVPPLQLGKMEVIVTILTQIMTDPLRVQFCDLDKYERYLSEQPN